MPAQARIRRRVCACCEKGTWFVLPERPGGCFAQNKPGPFFVATRFQGKSVPAITAAPKSVCPSTRQALGATRAVTWSVKKTAIASSPWSEYISTNHPPASSPPSVILGKWTRSRILTRAQGLAAANSQATAAKPSAGRPLVATASPVPT